MITKEECADYINANIDTVLTPAEIETLKNSIRDQGEMRRTLCEALIEVFGDVSVLIDLRDGS